MDNIGLMSETVNFIQGSKRNYDSSTMQGGVYFSKDSKEILLNGESYGNAVPADEEDLTSVNGALQLKNRKVAADNFQSEGYVILKKNIVDGKNILTQDMINQPNTIYEIRYDFDLNGETIEMQDGCALKFEGGSLSNGKLNNFKHTVINNNNNNIIFYNIDNEGECQLEWFEHTDNDFSKALRLALKMFRRINLLNRKYIIRERNYELRTSTYVYGIDANSDSWTTIE